ncbi:predicted membrane protein [Clostridium sp. CAG:413]|nr:predicted membrane protein [Clostridium sp. CAG:413]
MKTGVGKYIIIFGLGAFIYGAIEVIVRGYTHWTMALTGGAVMALFMLINRSRDVNILLRCLLGALVITSLEFAVGAVVNLGLGWDVWDYSEKPFNIMGQICPLFTLGWFALSLPGFMLCTAVEKRLSSR